MKAFEFCYWLQGCFELNPILDALSPTQTKIVSNHLALVAQREGLSGVGESAQFCQWLHGFIEARELLAPDTPLDGRQLALLKSKLSDAFRLDIDPSYAKARNPAERDHILGGLLDHYGKFPPGVRAMC